MVSVPKKKQHEKYSSRDIEQLIVQQLNSAQQSPCEGFLLKPSFILGNKGVN